MKIIKRISLLLAVALATVCLGVFASACNTATEYTVTVYYSDGTTAVDGTAGSTYDIQLCCYYIDTQEVGVCLQTGGRVGADGKATVSIADVDAETPEGNIKYIVHVWKDDGIDYEELKETVYLSKSNTSVSVVLKNVDAPAK